MFAGSNTTGAVAERLGRKWLAFELSRECAALSVLRFLADLPLEDVRVLHKRALAETIDLRPAKT